MTDEAYDPDYAPDGVSRFGAYVRQRAHLFVDDWEPLGPAAFAATVWSIACAPLMAPGYIRIRHDVGTVTCHCAEDSSALLAEVTIRLPWRNDEALPGWTSWQRRTDPYDDGPRLLAPPDDLRAVLPTATIRVPIAEDQLPTPTRFACLDVSVAKRAVSVICDQVNAQAGPILATLQGQTAVRS
jgi:hypothetical protein